MKITVLDWPENSPDLNPIANLWSIVKNRLKMMDCTNKIKRIQSVTMYGSMIKKLKKPAKNWLRMKQPVKLVLENKSGHISY